MGERSEREARPVPRTRITLDRLRRRSLEPPLTARVEPLDNCRTFADLLDHDEALVLLDDALMARIVMPRCEREPVTVSTYVLVLLERHPDEVLASGIAALASKRGFFGLGVEGIRDLLHTLVDLAEQGLIPGGTLGAI